jgi:hypothetical protein
MLVIQSLDSAICGEYFSIGSRSDVNNGNQTGIGDRFNRSIIEL